MTDSENEIPLTGGNVNASVVRVGDTVRRSVGPHSKSVHQFLQHLQQAGFAQAPRFLGIDAQGREILTFIPGSVEFPDNLWTNNAAIVAAARMLREFHDASQSFDQAQPEGWAYAYPDAARHEVICHNDFAPYNMVFESGLPIGIFDFDLVGPGPCLRDLAYLAYWFAPLSFSAGDLAERTEAEVTGGSQRLKLLCKTYGTDAYTDLLNMVSEVLHHMSSETAASAMIGQAAARKLNEGGHFAHWQKEASAFDANLQRVLSNLR